MTPFTPAENGVIQTISGAVGGMPVTAGLVGLVPALEFVTTLEEDGPRRLTLRDLLLWIGGVFLFGIIFAMTIRSHFIITEASFSCLYCKCCACGAIAQQPPDRDDCKGWPRLDRLGVGCAYKAEWGGSCNQRELEPQICRHGNSPHDFRHCGKYRLLYSIPNSWH
jgi:OPT oligopeptide transporter protein